MKRRRGEGTAVLRRKGKPVEIVPMRRKVHGFLDRICNDVIAGDRQIRGIAVVVTSRNSQGQDFTNWDGVYEDDQSMAAAIDLASFRLKLGAFRVVVEPDDRDS